MTKRILSLLLCASILLCAPSALAARKKKKVEPEPEPPKITAAYAMVSGTIKSVNTSSKTVVIDQAEGQGSITMVLSRDPAIIDNTTRGTIALNKVREGMTVRAWRPNTATSAAQASSLVMVVNLSEDAVAPQYMEIERVYRSGTTYTLLSQPQDVQLSLQTSAKISAIKAGTGNKTSALKPGAGLLYWPDSTSESYPAQVKTSQLAMLPYTYDGYILMQQGYLNVNGHMLSNKAIIEADGTVYVPMEEACKRLNLTTKYVKSRQTLTVRISTRLSASFAAEEASFKLGKEDISIPAPKVVDYVFYAPIEAVLRFANYKYVING